MLNAIRWQLADGPATARSRARPEAPGVRRSSGARRHQGDVPHDRVHRAPTCAGPTSTAGRPRRCWSSTCATGRRRARRSCTRTTRASTRSRTRTGSHDGVLPGGARRRRPCSSATLLDALPADAALLVTADHGQVQVGPDGWLGLATARTRWSRPTRATAGSGTCTRGPGRAADAVRGRAELHGGRRVGVPARAAARRGVARARPGVGHVPGASATSCSRRATGVGFVDPTLPYEAQLVSAHGSLTPAEMLVPLRRRPRPPLSA